MESITLTAQGLRLRHLSDEAVVDRTLTGDPAAFQELYRRFQRRIESFCASRVSPSVSPEDAAQETFMRVLRASPQKIRDADAWLFTVARNACNDLMRRAQHPEELVADAEELALDQLPAADTASELMRRQTAHSVFLALRRMPVRYRTAIILREFHGLTSAEISESMGVSRGAVDPLVSRARDAFGVAYAEVSGFPDACRSAVELIYRDAGTGIDAAERSSLDAHIATCPRCTAEQKRAHSPRYQRALAPLIALATPTWGTFGEALQRAAVSPGLLGHIPTVPAALVTAAVGTAVVVGTIGLGATVQRTVERQSRARIESAARVDAAQGEEAGTVAGGRDGFAVRLHRGGVEARSAPGTPADGARGEQRGDDGPITSRGTAVPGGDASGGSGAAGVGSGAGSTPGAGSDAPAGDQAGAGTGSSGSGGATGSGGTSGASGDSGSAGGTSAGTGASEQPGDAGAGGTGGTGGAADTGGSGSGADGAGTGGSGSGDSAGTSAGTSGGQGN